MKAEIATGHREVSEIAKEILQAGGNAFDAAAAAGMASALAESTLTSLGGGGFLLAGPSQGPAVLYDFFVETPGKGLAEVPSSPDFTEVVLHFPNADQAFHVGLASVAVPGVLKGLLHVQRKLGRMPIKELLQPVIALSRRGVEMNAFQASAHALLDPILKYTEGSRQVYAPRGSLLKPGECFLIADAQNFLTAVAEGEGEREFYEGEIAAKIAQDMRDLGGYLTKQDLAEFRVLEREPLTFAYRDCEILTNPGPSLGGPLVRYAFEFMARRAPLANDAESYRHLIETQILSEKIKQQRDFDPCDRNYRPQFISGTTHLTISDFEGNVAAFSSSNGQGSGYMAPGTGIMLNNMMGEDDLFPQGFSWDQPGTRIASMMTPTIVRRQGRVLAAMGSGGCSRIRTAILQCCLHCIDQGMSLSKAIEVPRVHWDGDAVQIEPGLDPAIVDTLAQNYKINVAESKNLYFGGIHGVAPGWEAHGDSRRDGVGIALGHDILDPD